MSSKLLVVSEKVELGKVLKCSASNRIFSYYRQDVGLA